MFRFSGLLASLLITMVANFQPATAADPHALYEKRCARCHASHGGMFVRQSLIKKDGNLIGVETRTEIGDLMRHGHGHLKSSEDIETMVRHLSAIFNGSAVFQTKCLICHERAVTLARNRLINTQNGLRGRYTGRDMELFLNSHGRLEDDEAGIVLEMLARQVGG